MPLPNVLELIQLLRDDVERSDQRASVEEICARLDVIAHLVRDTCGVSSLPLSSTARTDLPLVHSPSVLASPLPPGVGLPTPEAPDGEWLGSDTDRTVAREADPRHSAPDGAGI